MRKGEAGWHRFGGGNRVHGAAHRFRFSGSIEGGARWLTERWCAGSGGGTWRTEEGNDVGIGLGGPRHSAGPKTLVGWNG
jgi:hypothetical protein